MFFTRFLIEENSEDYVIFDKNAESNRATVRSRFRFIIGNYDLFSEEKEI